MNLNIGNDLNILFHFISIHYILARFDTSKDVILERPVHLRDDEQLHRLPVADAPHAVRALREIAEHHTKSSRVISSFVFDVVGVD